MGRLPGKGAGDAVRLADAERVQVLFVTVDPERDTREVLAKYVSAFDPGFLGLTGDDAGEVTHLWERECSLQRSRQKLIEVAPAPGLAAPLRDKLIDAALRMGQPGDLLLIFADALTRSWKQVTKFKPEVGLTPAPARTGSPMYTPAPTRTVSSRTATTGVPCASR